jgi:hypothetical protein
MKKIIFSKRLFWKPAVNIDGLPPSSEEKEILEWREVWKRWQPMVVQSNKTIRKCHVLKLKAVMHTDSLSTSRWLSINGCKNMTAFCKQETSPSTALPSHHHLYFGFFQASQHKNLVRFFSWLCKCAKQTFSIKNFLWLSLVCCAHLPLACFLLLCLYVCVAGCVCVFRLTSFVWISPHAVSLSLSWCTKLMVREFLLFLSVESCVLTLCRDS